MDRDVEVNDDPMDDQIVLKEGIHMDLGKPNNGLVEVGQAHFMNLGQGETNDRDKKLVIPGYRSSSMGFNFGLLYSHKRIKPEWTPWMYRFDPVMHFAANPKSYIQADYSYGRIKYSAEWYETYISTCIGNFVTVVQIQYEVHPNASVRLQILSLKQWQ